LFSWLIQYIVVAPNAGFDVEASSPPFFLWSVGYGIQQFPSVVPAFTLTENIHKKLTDQIKIKLSIWVYG